MDAPQPAPFETRIAVGIGGTLIGVTFTVIGLLLLVSLQMSGLPVALFLAPVLLAASWPAFARQARRERDLGLAQLLMLALCRKLFNPAPLLGGHLRLRRVRRRPHVPRLPARDRHALRAGDFSTGLDSLSGTDFIRFFTGLVYTVTGSSVYAGFLLYSWLAFWGMYFMYRTHHRHPRRQPAQLRPPAVLPAIDAVLALQHRQGSLDAVHIGLAAYGTARLLTGRPWRGLALARTALWLGALVRPHVTGVAALALVVAYLVARPPRRLRGAGASGEAVRPGRPGGRGRPAARQGRHVPAGEGHRPPGGGHQRARRRAPDRPGRVDLRRPSAISSPAKLPLAIVTVFFRPFPFRANNAQVAVTALESTLLLGLLLARRRGSGRPCDIPGASRTWPSWPSTRCCSCSRSPASPLTSGPPRRTQVLPFFLVLLAIPALQLAPRPAAAPSRREEERCRPAARSARKAVKAAVLPGGIVAAAARRRRHPALPPGGRPGRRDRHPAGAVRAPAGKLATHEQVLTLDQALDGSAGGGVVVTVDDGYRDFTDTAIPLLVRYQVPALLYLATGLVAGEGRTAGPDALSWAQLAEALSTGLVGGRAHHGHTDLSRASEQVCRDEMARSGGWSRAAWAWPAGTSPTWAVGSPTADQVARQLFDSAALDAWRSNQEPGAVDPRRLGRAVLASTTAWPSSGPRSRAASTARPWPTGCSGAAPGGGHEQGGRIRGGGGPCGGATPGLPATAD